MLEAQDEAIDFGFVEFQGTEKLKNGKFKEIVGNKKPKHEIFWKKVEFTCNAINQSLGLCLNELENIPMKYNPSENISKRKIIQNEKYFKKKPPMCTFNSKISF